MAFMLGEAVGMFLVSLLIATIWLGASWQLAFFKRRQDAAHYIAFALGAGLIYVGAVGSGGFTGSHMLAALFLALYLGTRAYRRMRATPKP